MISRTRSTRLRVILVQNGLKKQDLEKRLIAANLGMAELAAQFPSAKQSMDVEEALFSAAADSGVGHNEHQLH